MRAVVESGGAFVTASDEDILAAIPAMARGSGVFGEPAGAAAYAGLVRAAADGQIDADDRVVVLNTGSGLKDVAAARTAAEAAGTAPIRIAPTVDALEAALEELPGGGS
jgi:threonine synthase